MRSPTTFAYTCVTCGAANAPCCAGNSCTSGCCVYSFSSTTATTSAICYAEAASCVGVTPAATCTTGGCGTCGKVGQSCCTNNNAQLICTQSNSFCGTDVGTGARVCQACGAMGQPCCGSTSLAAGSGTTGVCTTGLTCRLTTTYTCQP